MLKKLLLFLFSFWSCSHLSAQIHSGLFYTTNCKPDISRLPVCIDSANNVLYVAGYFDNINGTSRSNIAAIDMTTGLFKSWAPIVTNERVLAIAKYGNTIYIGGNFSTVNGQARNNLAAIDVITGNVSAWNPSPNWDVLSLAVDNNYLYVGGRFSQISSVTRNLLAVYNLSNHLINAWSPPLDASNTFFDNIKLNAGKMYGLSYNGSRYSVLELEMSLSTKVDKIDPAGGDVTDFIIHNNNIYCVGGFTSVKSIARKYVAAVSISSSAVQAWNPPHIANSVPGLLKVEAFRDTIIIGNRHHGIDTTKSYIKKFSPAASGNYFGLYKYYPSGEFLNDINVISDKLIEVGFTVCPPDSSKNHLRINCFKPFLPKPFTVFKSAVCEGDTGVVYTIPPEQGFVNYEWSYTGTGATIVGAGNSVKINFATNATSGVLKIKGTNICGLKSDERQLSITVNSLPHVSAGNDDSITCINRSVVLQGVSITSPITYQWQGPSGTATTAQLSTTLGGTYILTVTNTSTGCFKKDTAIVITDTLPPSISSLPDFDTINCYHPIKILNANTLHPSDSLRWLTPSSSSANPCSATVPGVYVCIALNTVSGCEARDTITMIEEKVYLNADVYYTDSVVNCKKDSIMLFGYTSSPVALVKWVNNKNDTLVTNPLFAKTSGCYTFLVQDYFSGCITSQTLCLPQDTLSPVLFNVLDSALITCSQPSVTLKAEALPYSEISWTGSFGQQFDSVTVNVSGYCYVQAKDTSNGCITVDSVNVVYNPILKVDAGEDTLVCVSANVILTANVINGTPTFNFNWNSGAGTMQSFLLSPADTTRVILNVTDAAGCYGSDTAYVYTAPAIHDSIATFIPCVSDEKGSLQIWTWGGIAPYRYSIDNGITFQELPLFGNLPSRHYTVLIKDSLGCTQSDTATLGANSFSPEVNFLVSTNFYEGDTLVLVDISNPRPDTVMWEFPGEITVINDNPFSPVVVNNDTGMFIVKMKALYGDCLLEITKQVNVFEFDSLLANKHNNNGIESVLLSPNPNTGNFNVDVKLYAKQNFIVLVYDAAGVEWYRKTISKDDFYMGNINLSSPVPGTYLLRVIAEYDAAAKTFIITK